MFHRRIFITVSTLFALLVLSGAPAFAQTTSSTIFTHNLSLGASGPEVLALQKRLNEDPATQVARTGPGSPGHETDYFGALTKGAVMRFQQKYAASVLAPVQLTAPNGFVGFYTRAKLNSLSTNTQAPSSAPKATTSSSTTVSVATTTNPNVTHLDAFITALDALGKKQGETPAKLAAVENAIRTTAATTTDLAQTFLAQPSIVKLPNGTSLSMRTLDPFTRLLANLGIVHVAEAAAGVSFGGRLFSAVPCTCSPGNWLLYIQPLPPSYATVLSYESGSQLFSSYNLPFSTALLGTYVPGVPACWFYAGVACAPAPQEGVITPMVGSSALP